MGIPVLACSRATSTPFACTQVAHKLLAKFSREHAHFCRCTALTMAITLNFRLVWALSVTVWRVEQGDWFAGTSSLPYQSEKKNLKEENLFILYFELAAGHESLAFPTPSTATLLFLFLFYFFCLFCQFNFLVYFTFQFKWRQIAGPLARLLHMHIAWPEGASTFDAYLYIVVNNFYSQSFAF